jgi:predicted DNA-binding protein
MKPTRPAETVPARVKETALGRSSQSCIDKMNTLRIIIEQRMKYTVKFYLMLEVFEKLRVGNRSKKFADREEIWQPSTQSRYIILRWLYISSCERGKNTSPQKQLFRE